MNLGLWPVGEDPFYTADQYAKKLDKDEAKQEAWDAIKNSLIGSLVKSAAGAAALPGDVYAGRVDPMSQQGIERAADLAGFTTLGSFAASRPAGSIGMGGMPEKPGIRAYHGSPHDFDKFDMSKIGTGEGAQAYGHGLYFADNEAVARNYRDQLGKSMIEMDGKRFAPAELSETIWKQSGNESPEFLRGVMDAVQEMTSTGKPPSPPADLSGWMGYGPPAQKEGYAFAAKKIAEGKPSSGSMYEVNIRANPDDFLDWDMPFAGQSRPVQDAIKYAFGPQPGMAKPGSATMDIPRGVHTRLLSEKGIPGIKYLDQGSRAAGGGSRNYVVFDDKLIEILRKYGLTGLLGLGAAGGAYQSQTQEGGT